MFYLRIACYRIITILKKLKCLINAIQFQLEKRENPKMSFTASRMRGNFAFLQSTLFEFSPKS